MSRAPHLELSPNSVAYADCYQDVESASVCLHSLIGSEVCQVRYFGIKVEGDCEWTQHGWQQEEFDELDYGLELVLVDGQRLSVCWMRFLQSLCVELGPFIETFFDSKSQYQEWDVTERWISTRPRKLSSLTPFYAWNHWFGHDREVLGMESLLLAFTDGDNVLVSLLNYDTLAIYHSIETAQNRGSIIYSHPDAVFYDHQQKRVHRPNRLNSSLSSL